jgi:hypothetical protein
MRNLLIFSLLVLLLVAAQYSSAQTVDEIINRYIDSCGGKDKLTSIKSIYMEGSREMMGNEVTVRVTKEQGKLSRTEFEMGSTNGFILITDKDAWTYIPMRSPTPTKLPDNVAASMQTELDIPGPLVDYAAKGNKVELIGKDTLDDHVCYKIKLTTAAGKDILYWIDAQTYLLTQSSQKGNGMFGGGNRNADEDNSGKAHTNEVITVYKDYSPVDGILIAHTIELKSPNGNGRGAGGTTFDKIELNVPIDAKLYKPE